MTRLEFVKAIKVSSVFTKFQKEQLNKFFLKSLTWGVCHKVANVGTSDVTIHQKRFKGILSGRKNVIHVVSPRKAIKF